MSAELTETELIIWRECVQQGRDAYRFGKSEKDNPHHDINSIEYQAWLQGWHWEERESDGM